MSKKLRSVGLVAVVALVACGGGDDAAPSSALTTGPAATVAFAASREAREAVLACLGVAKQYHYGAANGIGAADVVRACENAQAQLLIDGPGSSVARGLIDEMLGAVRQSAVTAPDEAALDALAGRIATAVGIG